MNKGIVLGALSLLLVSCAQVNVEKSTAYIPQWDTIGGVGAGTLLRLDSAHSAGYLGAARPLDVWLPSSYDGKRKHAVLFMFDGQMLFDGTTTWNGQEWNVDETLDSLIDKRLVLPTIVVGLYNGGAMRNFEYFPEVPFRGLKKQFSDSTMADIAKRYGSDTTFPVQSDRYLDYIVRGVKPLIDSTFRVYTEKSTTAIAGSSMGGLMSMYAIGQYPDVFGAALCMSTHWPGGFAPNEEIPSVFKEYVAAKLYPGRIGKIYFDYGTETLDAMYEPFQDSVNAVLEDNGFVRDENWRTLKFPGAAHDERSWAARLHIPLQFALKKQR